MSDPLYRLESRPLAEDDRVWVERFTAGDAYWEFEVAEFLRVDALEQMKRGYNTTTLFSLPGDRELVGFIAAAGSQLKLKKLQAAFPYLEPDDQLERVPVVLVPFFGVDRRFQGNTYGQEIHTQLLDSLARSMAAARFVYLECWQDNNKALRFYDRLGYEEFDDVEKDRPDGGGKVHLLKLAYDRFRLPATDK